MIAARSSSSLRRAGGDARADDRRAEVRDARDGAVGRTEARDDGARGRAAWRRERVEVAAPERERPAAALIDVQVRLGVDARRGLVDLADERIAGARVFRVECKQLTAAGSREL